jgi:hypothetical protein
MLGARVGKATAGGGGAPAAAAMARRGAGGSSGWRGEGELDDLLYARARGDGEVTTGTPPWYLPSAGARTAGAPPLDRRSVARTRPVRRSRDGAMLGRLPGA